MPSKKCFWCTTMIRTRLWRTWWLVLQLAEPSPPADYGPAQGLPPATTHHRLSSFCLPYHTMLCPCLGYGRDSWVTVVFLSVLKCVVSQHFLQTQCLEWRGSTCINSSWWCSFPNKSRGSVPGFGTVGLFKNGMNDLQRRNWRNWAVAFWCRSDLLPLGSVYLTAGKAAGPNGELVIVSSSQSRKLRNQLSCHLPLLSAELVNSGVDGSPNWTNIIC